MESSRKSSERTTSSSSNKLSSNSARKINFDLRNNPGDSTEDVVSVKSDSNHVLEVVHEKATWADRVKNKKVTPPKVREIVKN